MIALVEPAARDYQPSRSATRFPVSMQVELVLPGGRLRCTTRNLSLGGVFVDSPLVLVRDTAMLVCLALPGEPAALEVRGMVRWSGPGGFGVRFHGLRAGEVWSLGQFLEELPTG